MTLLCSVPGCEVERKRKAMNDWRAEQIAKGYAKEFSENDYALSCSMCPQTKCWRRSSDGTERIIDHA